MGQHSARRSGGAMTSVAGRSLFTATAAMALLGGGTSMAFAGEAPSSGHEDSHSENAGHVDEGQGGENESCQIPVVDDTTRTGEATVNGLTGDASAPLFEAGGQATQPVHDVVCPPAEDLLGPILGGEQPSSDDDDTATQEGSDDEGGSTSEDSTTSDGGSTSDEGTTGGTSDEGTSGGTSDEGSGDEGTSGGAMSASSLPIQGMPI